MIDHGDPSASLDSAPEASLCGEDLRALALRCGADDAGAVPLHDPLVAEERPFAEHALPGARSLVALVLRLHVDNLQSPSRSVASLEVNRSVHRIDEVARQVAVELARLGHRSISPSSSFPMEVDRFPERMWVISHKRVAEAAQLGRVGLNHNLLHPRFGASVLLGTVVTTAGVRGSPLPLGFDPCLKCKLCVAACPVGAVEASGEFRFSACYDHSYFESLGSFTDFVEEVAAAGSRASLRKRVTQAQSTSMWQALAFGPNYTCAYCVAVCPAGEDHVQPFKEDRAGFLTRVLRPLQALEEPVQVVAGSDAEAHVKKRFPHKRVRRVRSSLRATSLHGFFQALPLIFQRGPARGWTATFHFELQDGNALLQRTVRVNDGTLEVGDGLAGVSDVCVTGLGMAWLDVASGQCSAVWAVLRGALRVRGRVSLLARFARCFPR